MKTIAGSMLKKVSERNKEEKLGLIQTIATGGIGKSKISENILCACRYKDYYQVLMVAATSGAKITILGEARKARVEIESSKK
jgi:hypothetical protein